MNGMIKAMGSVGDALKTLQHKTVSMAIFKSGEAS